MVLNVSKSVFVSIRFPSFLILKRLQAVTPCCLRYSVMFSLVSFLSILSRVERQKSFSRGHGDNFFGSIAMRPTLHGALQGDV